LRAGRHKFSALSLNNSYKSTEAGVHSVYLGRKIEDNAGTEADPERRLGQACDAIIFFAPNGST